MTVKRLINVGVILSILSIPLVLVAIWTGDDRYTQSAVVAFDMPGAVLMITAALRSDAKSSTREYDRYDA